MRFPPEDGGRSLADMAHHDLDAALQLLASRAQYITGANGAAIALRRRGKNDMLCRASTGSNAPELGALLSTEFGLSGESVRTRQPLRCDDAERDARVNREVCHQLGIASVVVMPVVNDDEVLGVFELFSGKVNAFGDRDLSALQRLSEMVETAVRLARAAESLPEHLTEVAAEEAADADVLDDEILEVEEPVLEVEAEREPSQKVETPRAAIAPIRSAPQNPPQTVPQVGPQADLPRALPPAPPKKPLFWSAALDTTAEAEKLADTDQSHVPPGLRNLKKCEACGFPVSAGRVLCVECEEKKWRGQLRVPRPGAPPKASSATPTGKASGPVVRPSAAGAQSGAAVAPVLVRQSPSVLAAASSGLAKTSSADARVKEIATPTLPVVRASNPPAREAASAPTPGGAETSVPAFLLSAGIEPSQSWLSANKLILGAILVAAATAAAILLLR
jgi:hypothetical protein